MATKTFSREELRAFEKELEPYRVHKVIAKEPVSYIDFDAYLIAQRVCVRQEGYYAPAIIELQIGRYNELCDKFEQLKRLFSKRAYAKKKELEEQDAMHSAQEGLAGF